MTGPIATPSNGRKFRWGTILSVPLGWGFVGLAEWQGLHEWGARWVYDLGASMFLAMGLMAPLPVAGLFLLGVARRSRWDLAAAVVATALWAGGFVGLKWSHRVMRHAAVPRVEQRATPIIESIASFTRDRGRPPARLAELTPAYMTAVPSTGMAAFPDFDYWLRDVPGMPPVGTDDPWLLRVDTAFGGNFDSMVYVPSGRYPAIAWGGTVVCIGRWAYVWE